MTASVADATRAGTSSSASSAAGAHARSRELASAAFVAAVWIAMAVAAAVYVARCASPIPLGDDVEMIGPSMPGSELDAGWLWSAHNEHRVPIARALFVALVRVFHDLRAVMYAEVAILAMLALAMILVARSIRGRTSVSDAFFPLVWLHWGDYQNLLTAFQISVALAAAVAGSVLMLVAGGRRLPSRASAVACGACVCSLALCGGHGLAQMPMLVAWLALVGFASLRSSEPGAAWSGRALLASSALALGLFGVYFVGLAPSLGAMHAHRAERIAVVALQFLGLAPGRAGARTWTWSLPLELALCVASVILLARTSREDAEERWRAGGILAVLAGVLTLALAVGWGRGDVGWGGFAARYVSLPTTLLCGAYFAWCRYGPPAVARWMQVALLAFVLGLLPINVREGLIYGRERASVDAAFREDVARGLPNGELAARHAAQFFSDPAPFEQALDAMRRAGWPPFETGPDAASAGR
jgi:hypothetical protein